MKRRQRIRRGMLIISLLLFPVTLYYLSPYVIIAGAAAGVAAGSMLVFGAQFVSSLFLGRAFCGWLCPAGGLGECLLLAQDSPARGGRLNWIKYAIWAPWLGFIIWAIVLGGGLTAIDPLFMTTHGVSVADAQGYIVYYVVIALIVALALTSGRRAFCHYACWMAPFVIIGSRLGRVTRIPMLHLAADAARCVDCTRCNRACSMSLDVHGMVRTGQMRHDECILCGACVDACPQDVLSLAFGRAPR